MNIVVLGGHGFVGTKLSERLARDGHHVMPMSRRDGLDLTDFDVTRRRFLELKPDVIYHCAAHVGSVHYVTSYAGAVTQDNVRMALNIYRAVQEVCPTVRIVNPLANCSYPGTADVYYESEWEKGEVHPSVYAYGNSKRMTYVLSWAYRQQYGTKSVNFFVPNTFGPGDHTDPNKTHAINGMILRMIKAQRAGDKEFEVWGTGN
ncbi:MAG TPA: NAD-dependent epimerase/dehydratase family protein, partial [Bacteroidota bacterium]|nr:NAD-dependent epimerase/dehydratase family protein [Bacteroidota bacterium]